MLAYQNEKSVPLCEHGEEESKAKAPKELPQKRQNGKM
jgi:hypothetical protein